MAIRAPGVIKLFGEHAVVYGKHSLALAISKYAACGLSGQSAPDALDVDLGRIGFGRARFTQSQLEALHGVYKGRKSQQDYVNTAGVAFEFLPFATIAARLLCECGTGVLGKRMEISSEIPIKSGLASSAAGFTAFACTLAGPESGLGDKDLIDIAREGERVAHVNENAGSIDVSTTFYGGYTSYVAGKGAAREDIDAMLNLILVNSGPKLSTAETVGHVARLYGEDKEKVGRILDEIDACTLSGLDALRGDDNEEVGKLMFANHELLKRLEVSNGNLDRVVALARSNGALGAKLSGGGGGGMAVVLAKEGAEERLISLYKSNGFDAFRVVPALDGAKGCLNGAIPAGMKAESNQ